MKPRKARHFTKAGAVPSVYTFHPYVSRVRVYSRIYRYVVPYSVLCPIAVHGPSSGLKDLYRAVERKSGWSYCSKRLELRFAVAIQSPTVVHGPITVPLEVFQFPRRNVPLGISLSTDVSAFSSFQRETCESTCLSTLIFVPFLEQEKVWRGLFGENYNRIAARGLGGLGPRSTLRHLLRLCVGWRLGLRPLLGS